MRPIRNWMPSISDAHCHVKRSCLSWVRSNQERKRREETSLADCPAQHRFAQPRATQPCPSVRAGPLGRSCAGSSAPRSERCLRKTKGRTGWRPPLRTPTRPLPVFADGGDSVTNVLNSFRNSDVLPLAQRPRIPGLYRIHSGVVRPDATPTGPLAQEHVRMVISRRRWPPGPGVSAKIS